MDVLFLGRERLAAAELFEHVVDAGEREAGMLLLQEDRGAVVRALECLSLLNYAGRLLRSDLCIQKRMPPPAT